MVVYIAVIVSMLMLSAFFSGMESAFISSNRLRLELDRKQSPVLNFCAGVFIRNSSQYITTMLVGNNITLVVYSLFVSKLYFHLAQSSSMLVETLLATLVVIFVAEFIPKALVLRSPNFYLRNLAWLAFVFYVLLYPIAKITTWISIGFMRLFGGKVEKSPIKMFARQDLEDIVEDNAAAEDVEEENEIKLFQNVLDFPDLSVRDCMVPRVDIEAVSIAESISVLRGKFEQSKFSRIFVWSGSIDNIVGYVHIKSLFVKRETIREVMIPVDYVPESMPAQGLMAQFTKRRSSVAVVLDEFGATAGIISLEDLLEEIFGEIEDEHDSQDLIEKELPEGEYLLSCRLEVDYLNEKYGFGIPESDEYDTLAGYAIFLNGGIPRTGQKIESPVLSINIVKSTSSRVLLARVRKVS
ncbi:MAG: HlyC/CorC family transporter [Rikenellaceae bacterium]|nr:HlyC/CorC family transporter [Rikenellaceae bacterium]